MGVVTSLVLRLSLLVGVYVLAGKGGGASTLAAGRLEIESLSLLVSASQVVGFNSEYVSKSSNTITPLIARGVVCTVGDNIACCSVGSGGSSLFFISEPSMFDLLSREDNTGVTALS